MEKKLALCIGINDYPGTGSDLSGCVNDANDWGKLLSQKGFTVKKLLDKEATRKNILDNMKSLIDPAIKGDSIIFQYSGHGTYIADKDGDESDGTDECLCPSDLLYKGRRGISIHRCHLIHRHPYRLYKFHARNIEILLSPLLWRSQLMISCCQGYFFG